MALRADSYGSVAEVKAFTRHLLEAETTFNSTTTPTLTEVEKFVDRASSMLNIALAGAGFTTPVSNSTAKLALDDWAVTKAVEFVEMTQQRQLTGGEEGGPFAGLQAEAKRFVADSAGGFRRLGVAVTYKLSDGLTFTGSEAQGDRDDRTDDTLEQPKFKRSLWDATSSDWASEDDD